MQSRQIVTPPAYFPVSLAQAKKHLNITHSNHDEYIWSLIAVATFKAEQITRRRLITQTWNLFLENWPCGDILLPFGQLQDVTHIKYKDVDGTQSTWDSDEYIKNTTSELGRVSLIYSGTYPSTVLYPINPIEIQFVCGYGTQPLQTISAATNATPIVATITGHGHTTGDQVYISGGTTLTAINGWWPITKVTDDTFSLNGSIGNGAYDANSATCTKQNVPSNINKAMLLMISDFYEQREDLLVGTVSKNLRVANQLLLLSKLHEEPTG